MQACSVRNHPTCGRENRQKWVGEGAEEGSVWQRGAVPKFGLRGDACLRAQISIKLLFLKRHVYVDISAEAETSMNMHHQAGTAAWCTSGRLPCVRRQQIYNRTRIDNLQNFHMFTCGATCSALLRTVIDELQLMLIVCMTQKKSKSSKYIDDAAEEVCTHVQNACKLARAHRHT